MNHPPRRLPGGFADPRTLPRGPGGRPLCRYCQVEVPRGRRTFCSAWCVHEWRLRTDPGYLRDCVLERDRGRCALCGLDTRRAWNHLRRLRGAARAQALAEWGLRRLTRRSLWDADHIVPVALGGGDCDLTNLRTLCLKCHRQATRDLVARLPKEPSAGGAQPAPQDGGGSEASRRAG